MTRRLFTPLLGLLLACSSDGLDDEGAIALVRTYNQKLIEAYRTSDINVVDPFVGLEEGTKLLGLIGVKSDMALYLDARLDEMSVAGVGRPEPGVVVVMTTERWAYADRKLGTGEQVGEASVDRYRMRYVLGQDDGRWVVTKVEFAEAPDIGRKTAPGTEAPPAVFHGPPPPPSPGSSPPDPSAAR